MTRISTLIGILILSLLAGLASAQEVRNEPRAIVVNPNPSFGVSVFLDKEGEVPAYRVGEEIRVSVRVDRDAYVYLFSIQPDGTVTQIMPNRFSDDNRMRAGETRTFPARDAGYVFNVEPPTGTSSVVALASTRELDTRELARFQEDQAFATSEIGREGFQSAFRIVVNPVPQSGWATATTHYDVVRTSGQARGRSQATLAIESDPRGAEVYVDGRFQGTTPLRVETQPGRRTIRIEREDHRTFERTIQLSPGENRRIEAGLERVRRTGTVRFESSPSGADVYVNGSFEGTTPISATTFDVGTYEVRYEMEGHASQTFQVTVNAGSQQTVRRTLRPLQGSLRVYGNVGGAQVYLDGEHVGTIPSGTGRLDVSGLDPDSYQLTVVASGYHTIVEQIDIYGGERTEVRLRQERR